MSGLNSLRSVFQKKGEQYVADLMNSYVVVNEKLEGSYFAAMLDTNNEFKYFKKGAEINYTDRVLNRFYNKAIEHFEAFAESQRLEIPSFYLFAMQYFPQTGRLVLSHIHELSVDGACKRTIQNKRVLESWAQTLEVEPPAILFEGRLTDEQKSALLQLLDQPVEEFKHVPFERALLTILGITNEREINTVVFRFYDDERRNEERSVVAKLASPAIESLLKGKQPDSVKRTKSDDFVWLILVDIINYIESFTVPELEDIKLDSKNQHIRYVQLINSLFKSYLDNEGLKWEGLELNTPEYLKDHKFDLNTDLISDTKVKELVNQSSINKEIYRIMLNMFRNPNVRVSSKIFSEGMKNNLKMQIEKLGAITVGRQISEDYFPTFTEFLGQSTSYSVFEDESESIKANNSVNVVVDYFQPVNKSHIKVAQKLYEKNGNKTIFIAVSQINDRSRYPLSEDDTMTILENTRVQYSDLIEAVNVVPNWGIEAIIDALGPTHSLSLLACTSKRIMDYAQHLDYYKRRNSAIVESIKNVELVEVDHNDFGDRVRETLMTKNREDFFKLTPPHVHSMFESLASKYGTTINESNVEEADVQLQEHVSFLKMVISSDSNVAIDDRSSIVNDLNVVKKKFEAKDVVTGLKHAMLERNIAEIDVNTFTDSIVNEADVTQEDLHGLLNLINDGIVIDLRYVNKINLLEAFQEHQINPKILDQMLNFKLKGHDGAGAGEFATALLFNNAMKIQENGDVTIDGIKIEVKNNDSQLVSIRSVNENIAFNDSHLVMEKRIAKLKEIVLATGSDAIESVLEHIDNSFIIKANYNFNQKGIRNYANLFKTINESIPELPIFQLYKWFSSIFVGGILAESAVLSFDQKYWLTNSMEAICEDMMDAKTMIGALTFTAFKYYANIDQFKGIMLYRTNNEATKHTAIFVPESINFDQYLEVIEPISGPSLVDARTSKSFKIRMRADK